MHEESIVWKNTDFYIEPEESSVPWLKIYTSIPYKELSLLPQKLRHDICELLYLIEKEMISFYKPTKINIASFGNYLPRVHWHIMARFENDSHYPEPMWGERQRESSLILPDLTEFLGILLDRLEKFK